MAFLKTVFTAAMLLVASLTVASAHEEHPAMIHIHDAYARVSGGIGKTGAVFFMMHNNTETDDRLVSVSSDIAKVVELHTHIAGADGVMKMTRIEGGIALPAGEMHALQRGGDHVMLMGLTRALVNGDTFSVTLTFEKAGTVDLEVTVDNDRTPEDAPMQGGHGHMKHGG